LSTINIIMRILE